MKTTTDDIELAIAYFNLRNPEQYSAAEIVANKQIRKQFLTFACRLLGTPEQVIFRRLVSLCLEL